MRDARQYLRDKIVPIGAAMHIGLIEVAYFSLNCRRSVTWTLLLALFAPALLAGGLRDLREPPTAYPMEVGRETRETVRQAPSSNLDANSALIAAMTISLQVKGARVLTVAPSGSMTPMFSEKAYLVVEPAAFDDLKVGDIITYEHPTARQMVVHRILEKRGDAYWTKGDHNERMDNVYVTRENYMMRVFAIIYAREDTARRVAPAVQVGANRAATVARN
jgi:signal peptidase I